MSLYNFHKYSFENKDSIIKGLQGSNQKALLVVLKADEKSSIPFLKKILAAIQMDWGNDILVVENNPNQQFKLSHIWNEHHIEYVLSFGVLPNTMGLNFNFSPYQIIPFQDMKMVFAPNLTFLEDPKNISHKKTLWNTLKSLFLDNK